MSKVYQLSWLLALGIILFLFLRYDKNPVNTGNGLCATQRIKSYALGYMHARQNTDYKIKNLTWDNETETYKIEFDNDDSLSVYFDEDGFINVNN